MARFLVTGAAGFIGTHLVKRLTAEGHEVSAVDRWPIQLSLVGTCRFSQGDLMTMNLEPLVESAEYIVHLAGRPGVRESWAQFSAYVQGNIGVTQRLLEAVRGRPPKKFLLASTSSIYGEAPMPAREDGPVMPVSPYGASKLAAEMLCDLYGRTAAVPWVAARYFTVYGPGQRPDMAFTRWLKASIRGEPVQVYGSGDQERDFTFVGDAVDLTIRLALCPEANGPVNVGGGARIPMCQALHMIETLTGQRLSIDRLPPALGDMPVTQASTSRLSRLVGPLEWTPLSDGLQQQYEWLRNGGDVP